MNSRIATALLAALAGPAAAHVVLEQKSAPAGSYYKGTFRVGHGCAGSPTTSLTVELPEGVTGAKPMPKPGWLLTTRLAKLTVPVEPHGKHSDETVAGVTWSGSLPDSYYDEFVVFMKLPDTPGRRWFKVQQVCETGRIDWVQIPQPGQAARELRAPAAQLDVLPADRD
jgi:uncharacterized protein YcnI